MNELEIECNCKNNIFIIELEDSARNIKESRSKKFPCPECGEIELKFEMPAGKQFKGEAVGMIKQS